MTDLAIGEALHMRRNRNQKRVHRWTAWREVIVTWAIAGLLLGALALLPNHAGKALSGTVSMMLVQLAPSAGSQFHPSRAHHDGDGSKASGECSDRDYANELC